MSIKKQWTVLIEGAGTATCISLLKGLTLQEEFDVRTIVIDMGDMVAGRHMADVFYKTVGSKDEKYIDTVLEICSSEGVDLYIPIIDYGFEVLSQSKQRFADIGTYLMILDPDSMKICGDKLNTAHYFESIGIPTAVTRGAITDGQYGDVSYPAFVKPRRDGRASLDTYVVQTEEELQFYTREGDNYVIQELIEGDEFTVDCLTSLDGVEFIAGVVRERIETKGGVSVKARVISGETSNRVLGYVQTIVESLSIPGICNIQGFRTKDGEIYISEINPRSAGTHVLSIQAGLNSIHHMLQLLNGVTPSEVREKIQINPNVEMVRFWNEIFTDGDQSFTWKNLLK